MSSNPIIGKISQRLKENSIIENALGRFEVSNASGWQGGTSVVKETGLSGLKRQLVIKFLCVNANDESDVFVRFKQAYINLLLVGNNEFIIPQIHFDFLQLDDNVKIPYILMQKADECRLSKATDFEDFEVKFHQLLDCIDYIHRNDIIHRDIKPENIFKYNGRLVLADFDISRFDSIDSLKLIQTAKNDRLCNREYFAPEQSNVKFGAISFQTDWFAFGQILHYLITGNPLRGQSSINFASYGDDYTRYNNLVRKLLSEKQEDRPKNKEEILDLLKIKDIEIDRRDLEDELLEKFERIVRKFTHSFHSGYSVYNKGVDIEHILNDLKKGIPLNENFLWCCHSTEGDSDIRNIEKINKDFFLDKFLPSFNNDKKRRFWLIDNIEMFISNIYFFKKHGLSGDSFIIIETDVQKPTGLYDGGLEYEEYGIYSGKVMVSRTECDTGYSIINGERIHIGGDTEARLRILKKTIFFIGPRGVLIQQNTFKGWKNEELLEDFYNNYIKNKKNIDNHMFVKFSTSEFKRYKPWDDLR